MRKANWKLVLSWLVQIVLVGLVIGVFWSEGVLLVVLITVGSISAFSLSLTYLLHHYYPGGRKS